MNERIRVPEVRLIGEDGANHGVVKTSEALQMAEDADLDLVLINPNQNPPVAKILNYGKYKYEIEKRAKEAKKKQHTVDVKEIKIRYKIKQSKNRNGSLQQLLESIQSHKQSI